MDKIRLFLFAHQDDEFGVFAEIERLCRNGDKVIVVYLTSGTPDGQSSLIRNSESLCVLKCLGVLEENVIFAGTDIEAPDGYLFGYLQAAYVSVINLFANINKPESIYFLSWEGGHQDHDAAHILGLAIAKYFNLLEQSYQFSLYTGENLPWKLFKLFSPVNTNGAVVSYRIPFNARVRYIKYIFTYRSQFMTWIGLLPMLIVHYLFKGTQVFQQVNVERVLEPPHLGKLLYERRTKYTYVQFNQKVMPFIVSNLLEGIQ